MEEKMRKNILFVSLIAVSLVIGAFLVFGSSAEDYKVIKKAVEKQEGNSSGTAMFRIEVTDKKTNKTEVKIKIPLSLIELLADSQEDLIEKSTAKCKVDLKKIIAELKKAGPTTLIEVDSEDDLVKIWIE